MILFIAGLLIGTFLGMCMMALAVISKEDE